MKNEHIQKYKYYVRLDTYIPASNVKWSATTTCGCLLENGMLPQQLLQEVQSSLIPASMMCCCPPIAVTILSFSSWTTKYRKQIRHLERSTGMVHKPSCRSFLASSKRCWSQALINLSLNEDILLKWRRKLQWACSPLTSNNMSILLVGHA